MGGVKADRPGGARRQEAAMKAPVTVRFVSGREEKFEVDLWGGEGGERLRAFANAEDLDRPLSVLVEHQYLRRHTPERPEGSCGPNPVRYEVNPFWDRERHAQVSQVSQDSPPQPETCETWETCGGEGADGHDDSDNPFRRSEELTP
jgi:hypothetical protein